MPTRPVTEQEMAPLLARIHHGELPGEVEYVPVPWSPELPRPLRALVQGRGWLVYLPDWRDGHSAALCASMPGRKPAPLPEPWPVGHVLSCGPVDGMRARAWIARIGGCYVRLRRGEYVRLA